MLYKCESSKEDVVMTISKEFLDLRSKTESELQDLNERFQREYADICYQRNQLFKQLRDSCSHPYVVEIRAYHPCIHAQRACAACGMVEESARDPASRKSPEVYKKLQGTVREVFDYGYTPKWVGMRTALPDLMDVGHATVAS